MSGKLVLTAAFVLAASCAVPGVVRTERLSVEDRVVFHFALRGPRHSMTIRNLGPGPIEVVFDEGAAHSHAIEIPEGMTEYVRPGSLASLEILHPDSGSGSVEWTISERARDEVEIETPAAR